MTQICVTLTEETTGGIIDRMADLAGLADLFEIRADLVLDLDLLTVLRAKTKPLVLTCLPASEGGRWDDRDAGRRMVLLEGVKRGFDYVDVNFKSGFFDVMIEKSGSGLIVSYHDLEATPEDLDGLYAAMCGQGADIAKVAVTPRTFKDVARFLAFADRVGPAGNLIPIALGPLGLITRILAGRYLAPFTYASSAVGAEGGPGQIPVADMVDLYRAREVTPRTRVYGVLGSDVARSLSPVLHNRAFQARQMEAVYVPLQCDSLEAFMEALSSLGLAGFSVTRPYKVDILKHLQEVEEPAAMAGSVNTVTVRDGLLSGSTTDGIGVLGPLKKRIDPKGQRAVILGAGGASRAAAFALQRKGAHVTVLARDPKKAALVASVVGCASGSLDSVKERSWDVLINATPVGSASAPDLSPVPAGLHRPGTVVFDMVYDPLETRLLREAQAAGCTIVDGLEMLIAQAAAQFETWTGTEAPVDVMRAAGLMMAQERGV